MARMLQALKNLEARSPRLAGPAPAASSQRIENKENQAVADAPPQRSETVGVELPQTSGSGSGARLSGASIEESIAAVTSELAHLTSEIPAPAPKFDWGPPALSSFPSQALTSQSEILSAPPPAATTTICRPACEIERTVQRTLSNTAKARPLRDMAARLRKDIEQTAAKTVAFVGLGPGSCHEAVLYAGILLAESGLRVLLVDGDCERRALSEALDYARETGFSELLRSGNSASGSCLATSVDRLSVLPAGSVAQDVVGVDSSRVSKRFEELAAKYDCLLIDGGRAGQSAARTLACVAQAAYFVVQLGAVEAAAAQAALAEFRASGARVLGCIAT